MKQTTAWKRLLDINLCGLVNTFQANKTLHDSVKHKTQIGVVDDMFPYQVTGTMLAIERMGASRGVRHISLMACHCLKLPIRSIPMQLHDINLFLPINCSLASHLLIKVDKSFMNIGGSGGLIVQTASMAR